MKKLLIILLLFSCTKTQEANSKEVLITVVNKCFCKITFYKDESFYTSVIYDCEYTNIISINIASGNYKVVAESNSGKKEMQFEKTQYSQNLIINF